MSCMLCNLKPGEAPPRKTPFAPTDPLFDLQPGYPKLAGRMGIMPETAMFRKVASLNIRNLLYFQSELIMLERRLKIAELEDGASTGGEKNLYARDYFCLEKSEYKGSDAKQLHLVRRIREVLKEYSEALIQQQAIHQMKEPIRMYLDSIQNFLASMYSPLRGLDAVVWGHIFDPSSHDKELIFLRPREGTDIFSRWMGRHALKYLTALCCAKLKRPKAKFGSIAVMDENVYKFTFVCTSIIASLFPVLSIIVLSTMSTISGPIAVVGAFNVAISLMLTMFTEAKRTDVFAVTAA